jgi:hypothetical protein
LLTQQASRGSNSDDRLIWGFLFLFLVLSGNLFAKFLVDKHLALDGVNYFFHILENRDFANIAWSRRFTEYLTEWPLVLWIHFGGKNIPTLIDIFAIGIYFPYLLSFLCCWYAVRDENKSLLWFPLAGYFSFNILSDYSLIADHHVMAVMTWPILLILLKTRPLMWREGIILGLLLVLYTRMYETAVVTAGLLSLIAMVRIFRITVLKDRAISCIALLLLIIVMLISVLYIADPRSPVNRGHFLDSIWVNRRNWEAVTTCAYMGTFALGWIISGRWKRLKNILFIGALVPISYYIFLRVTTDYAMTAYISFSSRTLSGIVLPALIVLAMIVVTYKRVLNRIGMGSFLIAFITIIGFNLADLRYWVGVKSEFLVAMNTDARYVSIDETPLKDSHYRWSWNNSLLSLVWSSPCVRTIILNSPDDPQGPVDPREQLVLKEYLKYDSFFRKVDPTIKGCGES